jgi:hypothetical protein
MGSVIVLTPHDTLCGTIMAIFRGPAQAVKIFAKKRTREYRESRARTEAGGRTFPS